MTQFFIKIWKELKHHVHLCVIDVFRLFVFKYSYTRLTDMDPKKPVVATVMSCFNHLEYTKKAVDSYYAGLDDGGHNHVLILIDDHSTDKTGEFFLSVGREYKNICYFRYGKNVGLTQTWNDGVRFALKRLNAAYIFLVNNDIIIPRGTLGKLLVHFEGNGNIGAIGPLTNSPGVQPLQDIRRYIEDHVASDLINDIQKTDDSVKNNRPVEIDFVNGFFMGFSREALEKNIYFTLFGTYYFNPVYKNIGNESEFQSRLKSTGVKIFLAADSFVFHYKDITQKRTEDLGSRIEQGEVFRKQAQDSGVMGLDFEGETCIPGKTPKRIEDDHFERYKFASRFVRRKYVLDIACGEGYGADILARAGAERVDAVDISGRLIDNAKKNYGSGNVSFQRGDIATFCPAVQYDVIVCFETIEHVPDHNKALANLYSMLRKGGMLLVSTPNRLITSPKAKSHNDKPANIYHIREFTVDEFKNILVKNRFRVSPAEIFGQRYRIYFRNEYLRRIYEKYFMPDERSSPVVSRSKTLMPKYFLIIARKT